MNYPNAKFSNYWVCCNKHLFYFRLLELIINDSYIGIVIFNFGLSVYLKEPYFS